MRHQLKFITTVVFFASVSSFADDRIAFEAFLKCQDRSPFHACVEQASRSNKPLKNLADDYLKKMDHQLKNGGAKGSKCQADLLRVSRLGGDVSLESCKFQDGIKKCMPIVAPAAAIMSEDEFNKLSGDSIYRRKFFGKANLSPENRIQPGQKASGPVAISVGSACLVKDSMCYKMFEKKIGFSPYVQDQNPTPPEAAKSGDKHVVGWPIPLRLPIQLAAQRILEVGEDIDSTGIARRMDKVTGNDFAVNRVVNSMILSKVSAEMKTMKPGDSKEYSFRSTKDSLCADDLFQTNVRQGKSIQEAMLGFEKDKSRTLGTSIGNSLATVFKGLGQAAAWEVPKVATGVGPAVPGQQ